MRLDLKPAYLTEDQLDARIADLTADLSEAKAERNLRRIALAEFKVGDRVLYRGAVVEVSSAYIKYGNVHYGIRKIKKDGSLYANEQEVWASITMKHVVV